MSDLLIRSQIRYCQEMLRIIRIVVALIVFFVITDFVVASNGGDVVGGTQGIDTAEKLRMGQFTGRARGLRT
jgi:hypothetical protein